MPNGKYLQTALIINANDLSLNLSPNLQSYSFDYSLQGRLVSTHLKSSSSTSPVITVFTESKIGKFLLGYSDIFYYRIWLIPTSINLDGVPQLFSTTITVWNAHFNHKNLSSVIGTNLPGITITGTLSGTFNALESKQYTVSLTSDVRAVVNGYYTFTFSDAEDPILPVLGTLSLAFPYKHNWESEWVETYTLKNGLIESHNGLEQTYKLTANPRRTFSMSVLLANKFGINESNILRAKFYNSMNYGKYKSWIIPIWSDVKLITTTLPSSSTSINVSTSNTDFKVGGYIYLYKDSDTYEILTIQSLTSSSITFTTPTTQTWERGCYILPAIQAKITDDSIKGTTINYGIDNYSIIWSASSKENELTNKIGTFSAEIYEGYPIFLWKHNFTEEPSIEIYSPNRLIDFEIGDFILDPRYNFNRVRSTYRYLLKNAGEISQALGFFKLVNGKQKPFWLPTYGNEIQIVNSGNTTSSTLIIKDIGYSNFIKQNPNQRDIILFKSDGTYIVRRIVNSTDNSNGTETIALSQPVGISWTPSTFINAHFLKLSRLDQDSLEVSYLTNESANISFVIVDSVQA